MNSRGRKCMTALICAASECHVELLRLLLEARANTNLQDNGGMTALAHAAELGCFAAVKVLLEAGADVNLGDLLGMSPLAKASFLGFFPHCALALRMWGRR